MCFFSNGCSNFNRTQVCFRYIKGATGASGARGPIGPQGPVGPTGATGPQGPSGLADGVYAGVNTATTVATDTIIPITQIAATPSTTLSVTSNAVTLPSGTYLISYGGSGVSGDAQTDLEIGLFLDGTQITGEEILLANTVSTLGSASKTIILSTSGGALSLHNNSTEQSTFNSATLTVTKIA